MTINVYPLSKSQPSNSVSGILDASNIPPITVTERAITLHQNEPPTHYKEYRGEGYPPHDLGSPGDIYINLAPMKQLFARTDWWQE